MEVNYETELHSKGKVREKLKSERTLIGQRCTVRIVHTHKSSNRITQGQRLQAVSSIFIVKQEQGAYIYKVSLFKRSVFN